MDDIKAGAACRHNDAARHLEIAAEMHRDAARQCMSGNFDKARNAALAAAETETVASRHAMQALDLYRLHADELAVSKAGSAADAAPDADGRG